MKLSALRAIACVLTLLAHVAMSARAELISTAADILTDEGKSHEPSISGDGRYVVFSSDRTLLSGDINPGTDVYLKDRATGALRLLSDARGGDQPLISADGRVVVYRATGPFPKIRLVTLRRPEAARTVSYPYNGSGSFRYADTAAISADGRYVAFPFKPLPGFSGLSDTLLSVVDTLEDDRLNSGQALNSEFIVNNGGRMTISRTGLQTFFETNDAILPAIDANGVADIYQATRSSLQVRLISFNQAGSPQKGFARHPVLTSGEDAVFFISDTQLSTEDTDGRATLYRSTAASGFASAEPIATPVEPVALSRQATGDGQYVTFLARKEGKLQPWILRLADGEAWQLAPSAVETGVPAISADNRAIAFATKAKLTNEDGDKALDVYVVNNRDTGAGIAAPVVTLGGVSIGQTITEGTALNVTATADGGTTPILSTALEVNGLVIAREVGASIQQQLTLLRGTHVIRALSLNRSNVPGESEPVTVIVRPVGNSLRITALPPTRIPQADGTTRLLGALRLDSTVTTLRGPFQIIVAESPVPTTWELFGSEDQVPPGEESIVGVIDIPALPANGAEVRNFDVTLSPTSLAGDGFQGQGLLVTARLREMISGTWVDRDLITLHRETPFLNEETPGPNGGIPQGSPNITGPTFNPATLQSLQIQGPARVGANGSAAFKATATFSNGVRPCKPDWEITAGAGAASISTSGVLTAMNVDKEVTVTVRATFGGLVSTQNVVVFPRSPKVSVRARDAFANESGDPGSFRIMRSSGTGEPLTVQYRLSGSATTGSDYAIQQGSVVIPGGSSAIDVEVQPAQDGFFDGRETVILTLLPTGDYRLGSQRTATVFIDDDEPFPAGLPDAAISLRGGARSGDLQANPADGSIQQVRGRAKKNKTLTFFCDITNRTEAVFDCEVDAGAGLLGFQVQYLFGGSDVTQSVMDGSFVINNFAPGESARLVVKIKPTAETPVNSLFRCPITVSGGPFADLVEAAAERSR
jgi:hypothetical protein